MPPKVLSKTADRAAGVLPVTAAARATPSKPAARLKLEIRRLPPGLTLIEFEQTLGEEWKLGKGRTDWREYRQGKLKSPGKLPEQSRCYLHLTGEALVKELEKKFLEIVFHDKAGTHRIPELKHLPPTLAFAPNQRVPLAGKTRVDNRQGTIDTDPEFIAFLVAETQPIAKPAAIDVLIAEKEEKQTVKSTPLIDDLREKKASKAKAAASKADKKGHARGESKDEKDSAARFDTKKVELAAKEAAKVLNKQAAGKQQGAAPAQVVGGKVASPARSKRPPQSPKPAPATPAAQNQEKPPPPTGPGSPTSQRGPPARQRGNAEGIKKMLQKDLGIRPKPTPVAQPRTASQTPVSATQAAQQVPTAPASQPTSPTSSPGTASSPAASTTKAYLKHANPSQGMTEILIQQALSQYGPMTSVTIDPRKGTAIAVFKHPESLKKAIEAKRVSVANGAVEVMEFRDRSASRGSMPRGGYRGGRGGGRGGRGGSLAPASAPGAPS